jgi:hypothetical protein
VVRRAKLAGRPEYIWPRFRTPTLLHLPSECTFPFAHEEYMLILVAQAQGCLKNRRSSFFTCACLVLTRSQALSPKYVQGVSLLPPHEVPHFRDAFAALYEARSEPFAPPPPSFFSISRSHSQTTVTVFTVDVDVASPTRSSGYYIPAAVGMNGPSMHSKPTSFEI